MRKAPQTPLLHATKFSAEQIEGWAMPASSMADGYLWTGSDSRKTSWNAKPFSRSLRIDNCVSHKPTTVFPLTNKHWESPAHFQQHSIHPSAPRLYAAKSLDSLEYPAQPQQENLSSPSSARGLNMANAEPRGILCETTASSIRPPRPPARRDSLGAARHHEMQPSLGMSTGRGAVLAVWSVGLVHKVTSGPVRPNEPQFAEAQAGMKMDAVAPQAKEVQNKVPQPTMTVKSSPAGNIELKPVVHKDALSHSASLSVYSPTKEGSADQVHYHSGTSETCSPVVLSTVVGRSAAESTESIGFYRSHGHLQGDASLDTNQTSKENAPQNYVQGNDDDTLLDDLNLPNSDISIGQLSNAMFLTDEEISNTQGKLICNAANVSFGNAEPHTRALHLSPGHSANLASKESYVSHMQGTSVKMPHQRQNDDILHQNTARSLSLQACLPETVGAKLLEIYTNARRRSSSDVSFSEQNNSHLNERNKWIAPSSSCMSNKQRLGEQRSFSTDSVISAAATPILHHLTRGQSGRVYMQNDLTMHAFHHPTGRSRSADILLEEDGEHEDEVESTDRQDTQKYRDSLKQAQGRVLRETSFRRNDLKIGVVRKGQTFNTDSNQQERQWMWLDRQWSTSKQHEPKERKSVHPDTSEPSNMETATQGCNSHFRYPRGQTLQRLHAAARQCSYSEPEKMHEVGRMSTGIMRPIPSQSRPQLKAVQQSALQRFLQRKTGRFHHNEEANENVSPASNLGQQLMNRQLAFEGEQRGNTRGSMILRNMSSPEGAHSFATFPEKSHRAYVSEINLSSLPLDSLVGRRQQWLAAESGQGLNAKNNVTDAQTGSALQSANRNRCGLSREHEKASSLEDLLERSSPTREYLHTRSSSSPSPNCTNVEHPHNIATVSKKSVPYVSSHQYDQNLRERSASCIQNDTRMQSDLRFAQLNQLYKQRDTADKLCLGKQAHQNITTHKEDTPLVFERVRLDSNRQTSDRLWGCRSAESLIEATSDPVGRNSFSLAGSSKSQDITTEGSAAAEDALFLQGHHNETLKCEHSNTSCATNPTLCSTSKSPTKNDSITEKNVATPGPQFQSLKNTHQPVFLAATASLEMPQINLEAVPCTSTSRSRTDSQNNFRVSVSPTQYPRSSKVLSLHSCSSREDDDVFLDGPTSSLSPQGYLPAGEANFGEEVEMKGKRAEALPENGGEIISCNQLSPLNTRHDTALLSEPSMQNGQEHKLIQDQSDHSAKDVFMLDLLIKLTAADDSFAELLENKKSVIGILEMVAEIFPDNYEFSSLSMDSLQKGRMTPTKTPMKISLL
uniref:protein Shroom2-like isoform X2 n=1 Tax=Myxine glutinosa TaxID=7769 RepID=UPI00358F37D4